MCSISMLTRNDHSVSRTARIPEAMAAAAGEPGWPGRRMRTEGCSGRACAAAAAAYQALTSSAVSDHAYRRRRHRTAALYQCQAATGLFGDREPRLFRPVGNGPELAGSHYKQ